VREIEEDLENNKAMRRKYGSDFDEPVRYMSRLLEAKQIALKEAEYNLVTLVSTYDHSTRLLEVSAEDQAAASSLRRPAPWSTLVDDTQGQLTVLTTSPILQFTRNPHVRTTFSPSGQNFR